MKVVRRSAGNAKNGINKLYSIYRVYRLDIFNQKNIYRFNLVILNK